MKTKEILSEAIRLSGTDRQQDLVADLVDMLEQRKKRLN